MTGVHKLSPEFRVCPRCLERFHPDPGRGQAAWNERKFCSCACYQLMKVATFKERFYGRSMPVPFSGCWIWLANTNYKGYGVISPSAKTGPKLAHRISYALANGDFDQRLCVCHHCDVPACINPDHLFLGTQADNLRDCARKGRVGGQKISIEEREIIRDSPLTGVRLAKIYGVTSAAISQIRLRKNTAAKP